MANRVLEEMIRNGDFKSDGWLPTEDHPLMPCPEFKPEPTSVLLKVREAEGSGFARFHGKDIQALFDAGCLVILTNGHKFHVHSEDWQWVVDAWDFLNGIEPRP